jgi:hypothetical protein
MNAAAFIAAAAAAIPIGQLHLGREDRCRKLIQPFGELLLNKCP